MSMTQLDTSLHRVSERSWMDKRRCRSRQVSGIAYTSLWMVGLIGLAELRRHDCGGLGLRLMSPCLCDNQSPEATVNVKATSLQGEEVMVNSRLWNLTTVRTVTMRGGTHFLATTYLSPKPVFHTETSTSVYPPREGTLRPTCWRLGEATRRRDTLTILTSDDLIHRGTHQRVTVLWARTSNQLNLLWEASKGFPSPDVRLARTLHHSGLLGFPLMVLLEIRLAGPVQHAGGGGGPLPLVVLHPKGAPLPKSNSREDTDLIVNPWVNHNFQINTAWTLRSFTRIWSPSHAVDPQAATKNVTGNLKEHLQPELL